MDFTETQQQTLRAALDRIIPPDDYPGAWEAGVGDYIARQLQSDLSALFPLYRDGLDALDAEAVMQTHSPFAALNTTQQDTLLEQISQGQVQYNWPVTPKDFFFMLVNHAAEGYYGDPGNGGNRDARSWEMIGFEMPQHKESPLR